jgi:hypothetical protein
MPSIQSETPPPETDLDAPDLDAPDLDATAPGDEIDPDDDTEGHGSSSLLGIHLRRQKATPRPLAQPGEDDILAYWRHLRGSRRFPRRADLDDKTVGFYWPHSIFFRISGGRIEVDRTIGPRSSLGAGSLRTARTAAPLNFIVTEWFLPVVRAAADRGQPIDETADLPVQGTETRYRGVALPFSDDQVTVNFVLAHLIVA